MALTGDPAIKQFASFAILDLETSNLPNFNFNKVSITELSLYGISLSELTKYSAENKVPTTGFHNVPKPPRILHKLTLLLNPQMRVHPDAEQITGLDNYMLEYESAFNENAANTVLGFIKHLQQPVCLVAHNGNRFDYPILRATLKKSGVILPKETLSIDSLNAFKHFDKIASDVIEDGSASPSSTEVKECLIKNSECDWQKINNTTPKRPITRPTNDRPVIKRQSSIKRRRLFDANKNTNSFSGGSPQRNLSYGLGEIYRRTFGVLPVIRHFAEGDVDTLLKLMLCNADNFKTYAEEHAVPFDNVETNS